MIWGDVRGVMQIYGSLGQHVLIQNRPSLQPRTLGRALGLEVARLLWREVDDDKTSRSGPRHAGR